MVFEAVDSQCAMEQAGTVSFGRSKMQYSRVIGNQYKSRDKSEFMVSTHAVAGF